MKTSKKVKSVPPSGIREFFELVVGMDDVISLGVGEPDFVTPWRIRESGIYSLEAGYTSYTSNKGLLKLRKLISEKIRNEYSKNFDPQNEVLITTGVSEAYDLAIRAIVDEGDEVVIMEPSYVSYNPCVNFAGGKVKKVTTELKNGFKPNFEDIKQKITDKTVAIVINYPNNPTGTCISKEKLKNIFKIAKENDIWLISDEIYSDMVFEGEKTSSLEIKNAKDNLILLDGFSKSYAMTGWRIGYAVGKEEIIKTMNKIHQYTMLCAPILSQKAAIEALKNARPDVEEMINKYRRRKKLVVNKLEKIGLDHYEPDGSFYVFPKITSTNLSSKEFAEKLLDRKKVAVVPGTAFGEAGEGFIRISFSTGKKELNLALNKINDFVKNQR
ncbi:pyridoxal phosphate-dependent aminotransferase [archaeon SCG-AAA382B04]|nr:pyridoxal phosphate-dependent aminotransferase [archaeon SCG-AAA382B04]